MGICGTRLASNVGIDGVRGTEGVRGELFRGNSNIDRGVGIITGGFWVFSI